MHLWGSVWRQHAESTESGSEVREGRGWRALVKVKFLFKYRKWRKDTSYRENGRSPNFLLISSPCENQSEYRNHKTIGPAAEPIRPYIKKMTFCNEKHLLEEGQRDCLVRRMFLDLFWRAWRSNFVYASHPNVAALRVPDVVRHRCWTNGTNVLRVFEKRSSGELYEFWDQKIISTSGALDKKRLRLADVGTHVKLLQVIRQQTGRWISSTEMGNLWVQLPGFVSSLAF